MKAIKRKTTILFVSLLLFAACVAPNPAAPVQNSTVTTLQATALATASDTPLPPPTPGATAPPPRLTEEAIASCPVTLPNGKAPSPEFTADFNYGNEENTLFTNLWPGGKVIFPPEGPGPAPSSGLGMAWAWYRTAPGEVTIGGQRLDAPTSPMPTVTLRGIADGYGESGFHPGGLLFPSEGCWEVTAQVDEERLTFVTLVAAVPFEPFQLTWFPEEMVQVDTDLSEYPASLSYVFRAVEDGEVRVTTAVGEVPGAPFPEEAQQPVVLGEQAADCVQGAWDGQGAWQPDADAGAVTWQAEGLSYRIAHRGMAFDCAELLRMAGAPTVAAMPEPAPVLSAAVPGTAEGFELVGHSALAGAGWHAGLALQDDCAYIGNRRSGAASILDISNPAAPTVTGAIPFGAEGQPVELRTLPERNLLVVADFGNQRLLTFDTSNCAEPKQLSAIDLPGAPHEFYLWTDSGGHDRGGHDRLRVLVYGAMFDHGDGGLIVVEATDPSTPRVVAQWQPAEAGIEGLLHSVSVSPDGKRAYLAMWNGGVVVAELDLPEVRVLRDSSGVARPAPFVAAHSVTPLQNADDPSYLLVTPELWVCPFGGVGIVSVADPGRPHLVSTVTLPENRCENLPAEDAVFTAHNPLVAGNLVFVSWYSAGLQVLDVSDPLAPLRVAQFVPAGEGSAPLSYIGSYPVQTWSYPILRDGLVYVVDIQSGLYVLRYTGPGADVIRAIGRAEGNATIVP